MNILYKFDKRIEKCATEVDKRNRRNFYMLSNDALMFSVLVFAATIFLPDYRPLLFSHGFLVLYSGLLFFLSRWCQQKSTKHIRLIMYLAFVPILLAAVLMGSSLDPAKPAVSIIIYICILPLFIIDKPWRILLYQMIFAVTFILFSRHFKTPDLFFDDIRYLPIYLGLGMSMNVFSLVERVESAENYMRIQRESERDALTGLYNRKSGEEKVKEFFRAKVHGTFSILDIDNFKAINDRYGHQTGDDVLREVSAALISTFRSSDVIWRLGGDEFSVFAISMVDQDTCRQRFEDLNLRLSKINETLEIKEEITVSIGCTICIGETLLFEDIYHSSDEALYKVKKSGKGRMVFGG